MACTCRRQEFWKFICCVLSSVTYGKKGHKLWSEIPKSFGRKATTKILRDVRGNTNLNTVYCDHYRHFYIYDCHWIILSYTNSFIYWMFLLVCTSLYPLQFCNVSLTRFKDFRTFWPCSFVDPSVKSTNNFWKVRGLIDGFNKSCRHIASGVEKMAYELMSAIQFCNTHKGDLLHYNYIFRVTEPLGIDMNNVVC